MYGKSLLLCGSLLMFFLPKIAFSADAARVTGELKANGIHFNDSSTLYSANDLLKNKGAWSASALYSAGEVVQSGGSSYVCIVANSNIAPPNVSYWSVFAAQGPSGSGINGSCGAGQYLRGTTADGSLICGYAPVFASGDSAATTAIGPTCTNYSGATVTIVVPAAGTIRVTSSAWVYVFKLNPVHDYMLTYIGKTANDCTDNRGGAPVTVPANVTASVLYHFSVNPTTEFAAPSAGSYTFYLNGIIQEGNTFNFDYARLFATWSPN